MRSTMHQCIASLLCIMDEAMKCCIKPHHVHIDSLPSYFYLNYVFNGSVDEDF